MASVEVIDLTADSPISDRALDGPPTVHHQRPLRFGSSPVLTFRRLSQQLFENQVRGRASMAPVAGPSSSAPTTTSTSTAGPSRRRPRSPSPDFEIVGETTDELTRSRNRAERNARLRRAGYVEIPRPVGGPRFNTGDDYHELGDEADDDAVVDTDHSYGRGDGPPPRQRRRVDLEDVIDVDEVVDVDQLAEPGPRFPSQAPLYFPQQQQQYQVPPRRSSVQRSRLREILGLDHHGPPTGAGAEPGPSHPRRTRDHPPRRTVFSPDPPPMDNFIPPVPPMPRFFQHFNVPMPVEPPVQPQPPLPPRRHPVMNLGGAILARGILNNLFAGGGAGGGGVGNGAPILPPPMAPLPYGSLGWGFAGLELPPMRTPPLTFWRAAPVPQAPPPAPLPDYKPNMTHPTKRPAPGFTFDFAPPTTASSSSSTSKPPPALVCVQCRRPLIINGEGDRRIWGLRCGHMLDARCVDKICKPPVPTLMMLLDVEAEMIASAAAAATGNAAGGAKDVMGKGKGKERAMEIELTGTPDGGIRSRLRSAHPGPSSSSATTSSTPYSHSATNPIPNHPPARRTKGQKKKGRHGDDDGDRIIIPQQEFDWYCPVARCGQLHKSVKMMDGSWKAGGIRGHKTHGAIAVFV